MKKLFLFVTCFLLCVFSLIAQSIDATINEYATKYGQERCYLHYDKATYSPGETIWFKAYLMNGVNAADESKNFYVDWTDEKGNLISHNVHPVVDATSNGSFEIPATYNGRFLHVKAYTKWMLNFDSSFLYNKDIKLLSLLSSKAKKDSVTTSLRFFPEGGDIVAGVMNRVAFKSNDQWGKPVLIRGIIEDEKGAKIDSIKVQHDGMGTFMLLPEKNNSYTAKWKDERGVTRTAKLPAVKPTGVSMQVTLQEGKRQLVVNAAPDVATTLDSVRIIGTMNQHMVFKFSRDISSGGARAVIPISDLPSGILTITIFDKSWAPLAERITFIDNGEYSFKSNFEVKHWGLNKRARNEISIAIPDSSVANLSIAVTDADIETDSANTIISTLMLTSELKGQVNNPAYYFSGKPGTATNLDLVMLTNGWRKFKWEDVVANKFPKLSYQKDTSFLSLSGRVYGLLPTQIREANGVILMVKPRQGKGTNQSLLMPLNANGTFNDPSLFIFDTVQIYYQVAGKGSDGASIIFMENLLPAFKYQAPANGFFNNQANDTLGSYRHFMYAQQQLKIINEAEGKILDNVVVRAKTKTRLEEMDAKYSSGLFSGDAVQFDLVNDTRALGALNIFNYLQGQVAGLQISGTGNQTSLAWRGGAPALFLNEMPSDVNMVSGLPVADIAYVKVFRPPFMGSFGGANGAIAIYTRRGDDYKPEPGKGLASSTVRGYTENRIFYEPNYSSFKKENEKQDIRTTLYWNPNVKIIPGSKETVFTFYNNDISRAFRVVIEGMTRDGRLTRIVEMME